MREIFVHLFRVESDVSVIARRLLDAQLKRCVDDGNVLNVGDNNPVVRAVLSLLEGDGLTGQLEK